MNWSTLTQENWIDIGISVLIFFATAFLGRWVIKFIFRKIISRFTKHTKTTFDDVIIGFEFGCNQWKCFP